MEISLIKSSKIKLSQKTLWSVIWHPTLNKIFCAGSDKKIYMIIVNDNLEKIDTIAHDSDHNGAIRSLAISACGDFLAAASFDSTISIFYIDQKNNFNQISLLEGHTKEVKSVSWHPNGQYLASCGRDCSVWVWEFIPPNEFMCACVTGNHSEDVKKVNFNPKNNLLASCGFDSQLIIYDMDEDNEWIMTDSFKQTDCIIWSVKFSPDGNFLAICTSDRKIMIFDTDLIRKYDDLVDPNKRKPANSMIYEFISEKKMDLFDVSWSPNGYFLAISSLDNSICIFKVNYSPSFSLKEAFIIDNIDCETNSISWRDGDQLILACGDDDGNLSLYRFENNV